MQSFLNILGETLTTGKFFYNSSALYLYSMQLWSKLCYDDR